jgi:acyl carrier protein
MRLDHLYARRSPRRMALAAGQTPAPAEAAAKRGRPMKLRIGWIPVSLSPDVADRVRARTSPPAPPSTEPMATPSAAPPSSVVPVAPAVPAGALSAWAAAPATSAPPVASSSADAVMSSYLQTMDQFLSMQQDVMQAFLGGQAEAPPLHAGPVTVAPGPVVAPAPAASPEPRPAAAAPEVVVTSAPAVAVPAAPEPTAPHNGSGHVNGAPRVNGTPAAETAAPTLASVTELLLKIVAERTGYPAELVGLDLDLEADLGIDSIKRVEILGSLQQQTGLLQEHDMEALASRKTLRQVAEFLGNRIGPAAPSDTPAPGVEPAASERPAPSGTPALPFIRVIESREPGRLVAVREVRLDEDRFLGDHTLGRDVSTLDPGLAGLPVMPLTMSMEMLAEAAVALVPGRRLVGMRDVRAHRWMALEGNKLTVRLVATARDVDRREVFVQAFEGEAPAAGASPVVEGTMVLGDDYPPAPPAEPFTLQGERPSRWTTDALYRDGMFHGPAFRGVASMDLWGEDGATATLRTLPAGELFASAGPDGRVTDPVLLDQPGQVVAFWMAEHLDRGFVVFPFQLEALHLFAPPLPAGRPLACRGRIALVGEQQVRSDLDVVDGDRTIARLVGWWDRRFDVPREFLRLLQAPAEAVVGRPWPSVLAGWPEPERFEAWRLAVEDFPEGFFTSHGGVWQRALAHTVLGRHERELWHAHRGPEPRRVEWLLGRTAAKAALRAWLAKHHGLRLAPADLELIPDADGRPVPSGAWTRRLPALPVVSLGHDAGVAVSVAGPAEAAAGVPSFYTPHRGTEDR